MSRLSKRRLRIERLEKRNLLASLFDQGVTAIQLAEGEEVASGRIFGQVFLDLDQDGQRDNDEPPSEGETVYLDLNQNRLRDNQESGTLEPAVVTDASGFFEFTGLDHGTHVVALDNILPDEIFAPSLVSLGEARQIQTGPASAVAVADIDDDGTVDLIAAGRDDNQIVFDLGDGLLRILSQAQAPSLGDQPIDLVAGDFDRDGMVDVAVATRTEGMVNVLLSQPPETVDHEGCVAIPATNPPLPFPTICEIDSEGMLTSINAADFDRDGDMDLVVSAEDGASDGRLEIFANNGRGGFTFSAARAVGPRPGSLLVGEFRTDFGPEVALLHRGTATEAGSVSIITIAGTVPAESETPVGTAALGAHDVVSTDLNADGHQDFIVANADASEVTVFWYNSRILDYVRLALPQTTAATAIAAADFDLDQDIDLLVTLGEGGNQLAYIANQSPEPAQQPEFAETQIIGAAPAEASVVRMIAADINENLLPDVVLTLEGIEQAGVATLANLFTAHRVELNDQAPSQEIVFGVLRNPHINRALPTDVDENKKTTALDALLIINQLGRVGGNGELPLLNTSGNFLDVNGDRRVTAGDALLVINAILRERLNDDSVDALLITSRPSTAEETLELVATLF